MCPIAPSWMALRMALEWLGGTASGTARCFDAVGQSRWLRRWLLCGVIPAPSTPSAVTPAASAVSQAQLDAYFAKVTKLRGEGKRSIRKANARAALVHVDWTRPDWRWDAGAAAENRVANID